MRFQTLPTIASAMAMAAMVGACTPEYRPETHGEGETLTHNFLLQAVNPRPNETALAPDQNGQRAADAYDRYREGKVIVPKKVSTSDLGTGSGAGAK